MNNFRSLSIKETDEIYGGFEPISLSAVIAFMAIGLLAIIIWKLYTTNKGKLVLPGGFSVEWSPNTIVRPRFK